MKKYDEKKMREEKAPRPKSIKELTDYIEGLSDEKKHDYGTCVYAVSLAATATFNYMSHGYSLCHNSCFLFFNYCIK